MDGAAAQGGDGLDGWWYMEVLVDGGRGEGGGVVERWRAPCRPGCGGGRWWRRWGEGDGDMLGPRGIEAALGILIPSDQI